MLLVPCALIKQFLIESTATNSRFIKFVLIKNCLHFWKCAWALGQWELPYHYCWWAVTCCNCSFSVSGVFTHLFANVIFADYFPGHIKWCCVLFNWCTCSRDVFGTRLLWKLTWSKSYLSDPIYSWCWLLIGNQPNLALLCSYICNYDLVTSKWIYHSFK